MATKTCIVLSVFGGLLIAALSVAPVTAQEHKAAVTFHKDVLPILQKNCQSCHRPGQIGPFSMLSYKETRPWAKSIKAAVVSKAMPPWLADPKYGHFDNDRSLKQTEIDAIVSWVDNGAAEGDPKDAPVPVQWPAEGWQVQPDVVVELPPHPVPARGIVDWENFAVAAPFKEDTWVTSVAVLPGEPSVVHHMCFGFEKHRPTTMYNTYEWMEVPRDEEGVATNRVRPTDTGEGAGANQEGTVALREVGSNEVKRHHGRAVIIPKADFCYLPGLPVEDYRPVNGALFVPAGSDIVLSTHYTTNGLAAVDKTRIGFTVTKTPPLRQYLPQSGDNDTASPVKQKSRITEIEIPPFEGNYIAPATEITFLKDIELVSLRPHAHVRAKSVQYKLIYPDGREEIVLNVPRYDFNWQLTYRTSLKIPKGSRMEVRFAYDNSANNKYNPDPSKWVYYGQQSWEEMGTPFLGFLVDRGAGK